MNNLASLYRSHTCHDLRSTDVDTTVTLSGWILRKRDHGGVMFIDLRDHYGVTQIVISGEPATTLQDIRIESVITVKGQVRLRDAKMANTKIPTGEIEVHATQIEVISSSDVLPFLIDEDDNAPEAIRLKSRFLELRREKLHKNIVLRSKVISKMREVMNSLGFMEFQTPILTSSSPEGARDFIVPSRLHPGKFYALPQAPQQFKQLLMVSGFDRYFQIAPCFRDEDARADRSPGEFYQLDMELSFVERDDIFKVNEEMMTTVVKAFTELPVTSAPFPHLPYNEAVNTYGSDKPDLRNPLKLVDVSSVFSDTAFRVFQGILADAGKIWAIKLDPKDVPSRKYFDDLIAEFTKNSGSGLGYLIYEAGEHRGSFQKLVTPEEAAALKTMMSVGDKSLVFIAAGHPKTMLAHLGRLRTQLGNDFDLINKNEFNFCWITDFPFYEEDLETGKIDFSHNPFSMPQGGMEALNNSNPLEIKAIQYDLILNGYELASGGIRNHSPEIMYKAFSIAGYGPEVVEEKFFGLLKAFKFGAPPHGGIAHGVERLVMLLSGEEAIRDVTPFPLAQNGEDLLMSAPSNVSKKQLREVHIDIVVPKKEVA